MEKLKLVLVSVVLAVFMNSCYSIREPRYNSLNYLPYKSAVQIRNEIKAKICLTIEGQPVRCIEKTIKTSGSGNVVKKDAKGSYVLTADHVCVFKLEGLPEELKVTIVSQKTIINDFYGRIYETEIVKTESLHDVCILMVANVKDLPIAKVADVAPKIGDVVYNIGFPAGIKLPLVALMYQGIYSGDVVITDISTEPVSVFSIVTIGGQSGSAVLNAAGAIIGMIHTGTNRFNNVAFSPTQKFLKIFIGGL